MQSWRDLKTIKLRFTIMNDCLPCLLGVKMCFGLTVAKKGQTETDNETTASHKIHRQSNLTMVYSARGDADIRDVAKFYSFRISILHWLLLLSVRIIVECHHRGISADPSRIEVLELQNHMYMQDIKKNTAFPLGIV